MDIYLAALQISKYPPLAISTSVNSCYNLFQGDKFKIGVGHFTVFCSVTWPMNDQEAAGDLVLIQTSLLLSGKLCCCNSN